MRRTTIVVALALVAACGGTDSTPIEGPAAPTTARPAAGTLVPSSSIAPTTTAEPSPPTSLPATAPTTVAVPTPDGAVDEATKAAVLAGYEHYLAGLKACGESPQTCDPAAFTAKDSPQELLLRDGFEKLARDGRRLDMSANSWAPIRLAYNATPTQVNAEICWTDATVVYDTRMTAAYDDDAVVDDAVRSVHTSWTFVLSEAGWRVSHGIDLSETRGRTCL